VRGIIHGETLLAPRLYDQAEALSQPSRIYLRADHSILSSRRDDNIRKIFKQSLDFIAQLSARPTITIESRYIIHPTTEKNPNMYGIDSTTTSTNEIPRETRSALLKYNESKNDDVKDYRYDPLPSDKKRIRLLRLLPGVLENPQVMCAMFEAEFKRGQKLPQKLGLDGELCDVEYEALSWRWGDEDNSHFTIMIYTDDGKMYKKRVSETLGLALKYLRLSNDRVLWIDAISIDQSNKVERSYQVSMMSLVYTRASQVCVWLGEDDATSRKAFKFIRDEISHLKNFDQLCNDQKNAEKWRAFLGLMQREWFSRRWVVQEIALASKASVYCGPDELEWRDLAIAVELFVEVETVTHRLSELLRNDEKSRVAPNWFEHISELGASLLVNATARIFREYQRSDETAKTPMRRSLLSLEYLVTSMSIFGCGRPHDSVYALIAIARDASPNPPTSVQQKRRQTLIAQVFEDQLEQKPYLLDYNSPYPDVCKEFVQFCIERCAKRDPLQALDVLCRPWAKDWQPGDSTMDEDKKARPEKERIIKRESGPWKIVLNTDKERLFDFRDQSVKQLIVDSDISPQSSGSPEMPTPVLRKNEVDISALPADLGQVGEDTQVGAQNFTPELGDVAGLEVSEHPTEHQAQSPTPKLGDTSGRGGSEHSTEQRFIDKRNHKQWREQIGVVETRRFPMSQFILDAFHIDDEATQLTSPNSGKVISRQLPPEEDEWAPAKAVIQSLGKDPMLQDIVRAKAVLAKVDHARAERAKDDGAQHRPSNSKRGEAKDKRPKHARIRELDLPSWVANINGAPFDIFPHPGMDIVKMGRRNADPLVGTPQDGHRNYSAGQSKVVDLETLRFKRRAQLGHYSLYLKGFCFDRVAKVSQVSQAGAIPAIWLDLAGWPEARTSIGVNASLDDPPTAFWRTLVADRGRNDRNPPYYYARACRETILKGGIRSNAVDTTALIFHERNSIIAEFCRRVQSVIWNRALIKTEKGALGLVSEEVREGDLICILYGCTVPVILRQGNVKLKTKNERKNEIREDGIETLKKLVAQVERYRERKLQYSMMKPEDRAKVKEATENYNKEHAVEKTTKTFNDLEKEDEELEKEQEPYFGGDDPQSDIDDEDDVPIFEEDEAEPDASEAKQQKEKEALGRKKSRQHKAKIRDPLRHYKFLDQAYIHGMMDGEAVRQKFYTGKSDHIFEIR
jgi:hypothetical protein